MRMLGFTSKAIFLSFCLVTSTSVVDAADLILSGAKIARFDDDSLRFESRDVVINGGRIVELTIPDPSKDSNDQKSFDVAGLYLMPGLIDLHTHIAATRPPPDGDDDSNYVRLLNEPLDRRTMNAIAAAKATLYAGFTTIRDVSTEGAGFLDVTLANAIQDGIVTGPRIIPSTLGIAATDGYYPFSADGRSKPQGAQTADTEVELLEAVRQQHTNGAKWIKIFADFPKSEETRSVPMFSPKQLDVVTKEAHRLGMNVAAHVVTDEAARYCIDAGVDTIEHGFGLSEEMMRLMRDRNIVLIPTLHALFSAYATGDNDQWIRSIAERIRHSGLVIGVGSDAGYDLAHGSNSSEILTLVELGFPATEVLRAATTVGADVLGMSEELGQIEVGYFADLVAYRESPSDDIQTISRPVLVVKNGVVVFDSRE